MKTEYRPTLRSTGVTIVGPEETKGQEDICWIKKMASRLIKRTSLIYRIRKDNEDRETNVLSPIIDMHFAEKQLRIGVANRDTINAYLNEVAEHPWLFIPKSVFQYDRYEISSATSHRGDFLYFQGKASPRRSHLVVVNITALGIFDGLSYIGFDGSVYFCGEMVGKLCAPQRLSFPVYSEAMLPTNEADSFKNNWGVMSFFCSKGLIVGSSANSPTVRDLYRLAYDVLGDRATVTKEDGVIEAKKLFKKLFP